MDVRSPSPFNPPSPSPRGRIAGDQLKAKFSNFFATKPSEPHAAVPLPSSTPLASPSASLSASDVLHMSLVQQQREQALRLQRAHEQELLKTAPLRSNSEPATNALNSSSYRTPPSASFVVAIVPASPSSSSAYPDPSSYPQPAPLHHSISASALPPVHASSSSSSISNGGGGSVGRYSKIIKPSQGADIVGYEDDEAEQQQNQQKQNQQKASPSPRESFALSC
jgi:hypothetical protein